jgi:PAS domain S-box-containing protein
MTCRVCHAPDGTPPDSRTAVTREQGRRVFRAMSTIPNEPRCHGCHDPATPTNGILLMDLSLGASDRRFFADFGSTVALGAVMVVLTVIVLVLLLRRLVHGPLEAIVDSSQRIVKGDLDARAPSSGPGEFTLLASGVNRMTDHLARSLKTVEDQRRDLQEILDAVDDEIVVLDRKRRVIAANRAFRRHLEDPEREITGHSCGEISDPDSSCAADGPDGCPVRKVFESGSLHKAIVSESGADGNERTIEIHASPLGTPDGRVDLAVEVRRDISERRQMEAILAHSEHMASLGLLASGLSHEINNPLGAIATSVEGLRRRLTGESGLSPETAAAVTPALQRIAQQVERGRSITNRLLRVSRPPGMTRSLVDVNHAVEEIVAVLSHDIGRTGVTTDLDLSGGLPPLRGDESRLGQVLMNLILNSIQSMDGEGGTLRIRTAAVDGGVQIEVRDTGCGIPPALMKRIYEPFFTTKPVGKGTGLGLFITHRLVSEMDGTIRAASAPGRGTVFTMWFPLGGREGAS